LGATASESRFLYAPESKAAEGQPQSKTLALAPNPVRGGLFIECRASIFVFQRRGDVGAATPERTRHARRQSIPDSAPLKNKKGAWGWARVAVYKQVTPNGVLSTVIFQLPASHWPAQSALYG